MGEVWRATDTRLDREVAIKVLPAAFIADSERLARFDREAKLLAQLHHSNIAAIFGLEDYGSVRALVMELVEGPTLAERLKTGPLPIPECIRIAHQIAQALEEAHAKGIVHRDLKPQNVKAPVEGTGQGARLRPRQADDASRWLARPAPPTPRTRRRSPWCRAPSRASFSGRPPTCRRSRRVAARWTNARTCGPSASCSSRCCRVVSCSRPPRSATRSRRCCSPRSTSRGFPGATPPALRQLLRRCLERNAKNRLHDIADARLVIDDLIAGRMENDAARTTASVLDGPVQRSLWSWRSSVRRRSWEACLRIVAGRRRRRRCASRFH